MAALKLSGAQVSTAPTASFPPTSAGMLTAPLWWAQMSLGHMVRECQAGAPVPWERLLHVPPGPLASAGETRQPAKGELSGLLASASPDLSLPGVGVLGKGRAGSGVYRDPGLCQGRQLPAGPLAGSGLGLPPSRECSPFPHELSAPFPSSWLLTWTCTHYLTSKSLLSIAGAQAVPTEQGSSLVGVVNLTFQFGRELRAALEATSQPPGF